MPEKEKTKSKRKFNLATVSFALIIISLSLISIQCFLWGMRISFIISFFTPLVFLLFIISWITCIIGLLKGDWKNPGPRLLRKRLIIALIAIILSVYYGVTPSSFVNFPLITLGMKTNIAKKTNITEIQNWALEILNKPRKEVSDSDPELGCHDIKKDLVPPFVDELTRHQYIIVSESQPDYMVLHFSGGGFTPHWGILVGDKSFIPERDTYYLIRLSDGVYSYMGKH